MKWIAYHQGFEPRSPIRFLRTIVCVCDFAFVCVRVYVGVCIYVCVCIYIYMYVCNVRDWDR